MKLLHLLPIILILCLIHSWLDFANAIKEKNALAKKGSLKVHSAVNKAKQTPIRKSKNPENTKSKIYVKKSKKNSDKNHNTKKLNVKTAKNFKKLPAAELKMDKIKFCKQCCPSNAAVNKGTIKREKNKRNKRQAYCPYHDDYYEYYCGMCYQNEMFSGADNQYVVEATGGGGTSSDSESDTESNSSSENCVDTLMCSQCETQEDCTNLSQILQGNQQGYCDYEVDTDDCEYHEGNSPPNSPQGMVDAFEDYSSRESD